jgi:hypothetical protein
VAQGVGVEFKLHCKKKKKKFCISNNKRIHWGFSLNYWFFPYLYSIKSLQENRKKRSAN